MAGTQSKIWVTYPTPTKQTDSSKLAELKGNLSKSLGDAVNKTGIVIDTIGGVCQSACESAYQQLPRIPTHTIAVARGNLGRLGNYNRFTIDSLGNTIYVGAFDICTSMVKGTAEMVAEVTSACSGQLSKRPKTEEEPSVLESDK
tara:strand:- start:67 stop:501 length:435 start_codon:yes stop_codon:yes gene_type:complete